jgi:Methyltransferase domain
MALRPHAAGPGSGGAAAATSSKTAGQPCGGLGRLLARTFRHDKPEILVLGPLCGQSVVYLAGRGARVHVENPRLPEPVPPKRPGEPQDVATPAVLDQPDGRFDLVLAWEVLDFVPPDRLAEMGGEIARVLHVGGHVFLFAHQKPPAETAIVPRYRLLADDLISREEPSDPSRRRYVHPNRDIERALAGLTIQGIQLQRTQLREILASKVGVG